MLRLDLNFDQDFVDLYNKFNLNSKGKELLELSGISRNKMDIATISKEYFNNNVSDISVDPNANQGQTKNFNSFTSEMTKGLSKLNGYYLLWKKMKCLYSLEVANDLISKCWDGKLYCHDASKMDIPYCCSASTQYMMYRGRPFGNLKSSPPKRSSSFIAQCVETIMNISQNFAGACAIGDLLVNYTWYLYKELDGDINKLDDDEWKKKVENDFQCLIHVIHNDFRIGSDSLFFNNKLRVYKVTTRNLVAGEM